MSLAFAALSLVVVQNLLVWASTEKHRTVHGYQHNCAARADMLYNENLDFRYGAFSGYTIGMVFITLQASLVIQASAYLADVEVDLVTSGPLTELQLFNTAALLGYLTCALFLVLYLFIATHQCAVCCGCCPPIKESKPQPANSVPLAERRSDPLKPASSKPGPVE
eukprot:CAMPEP_0117677704 /NCGR_PEP_ID=MMETSP0804-20121206/16887_1 /TAXON_ID=1074897 /ORGANISM="Tetraselmis astigmatica, Strain CCMP880" /LENGTH=165 /DNA_ID=CAMNT_0005487005 /DNA_START=328 /DNA_END=826 /DNA_ORIENTATION=-